MYDAAVSGETNHEGATILNYIDNSIQLQSEIMVTLQSLENIITCPAIHFGGNAMLEIRITRHLLSVIICG